MLLAPYLAVSFLGCTPKTFPCLVLLFALGCGPSKEEIAARSEKLRQQQAEWDREQKVRLLESQIRFIRFRQGEAAAARYRQCHTTPPTTQQDQLECKRLDEQVARYDAPMFRQ
jgi:hypothetical protein